jgi:hypothetical protein
MAPLCDEEGNADFYSEEEPSTMISTGSSSLSSSLSVTVAPPARRSVSFSSDASVHLGAVMSIDDYSEEQKCECWYQVDEMREIRREVKETVALMNRNVPIEQLSRISAEMNESGINVTITTHGLEGKTRTGKRHRKETRLKSLVAVFDEQTSQEMDGVCNPIMIAMTYTQYSYPMQVAAFQRAAQHQKETAAIQRNFKNEEDDESSPHQAFTSADTSSSVDVEATVGPIKYDFNECRTKLSVRNHLELEKTEDDFDSTSFSVSNENAASSELAADSTSIKRDENGNNVKRPYTIGPLRIRDRFVCLLPRSAPNNTRSLIGAFRVVQI